MTDLRDVFADGDYELVVEALYALRERKEAALHEIKQWPPGATFTARDFGIPQIDAILKRLDAEPAAETPEQLVTELRDEAKEGAEAVRWPSGLAVAAMAREVWGNPIPKEAYRFARDLHASVTRINATLDYAATQGFANSVPAAGHIGIRMEGGVIQSVWTDRPMDVVVIDYDTDGCAPEDIFNMPQDDGRTSECIVQEYAAAVMPEECQRIIAALDERDAKAEDEPQGMTP